MASADFARPHLLIVDLRFDFSLRHAWQAAMDAIRHGIPGTRDSPPHVRPSGSRSPTWLDRRESHMVVKSRASRVWFVADPHFDHANIIRYCHRPFDNVDDMNRVLLANWRAAIRSDDLVFFLGDMCFGRGCRPARWWLTQLPGRIVYVRGSHDRGIHRGSHGLKAVAVCDQVLLQTPVAEFVLVHDPVDVPVDWSGWCIHGHVHNNSPFVDRRSRRLNVGVDVCRFRPVSLETVLKAMRS